MNTTDDLAIAVVRLVLGGWHFSRTARKKCWAGSGTTASAETLSFFTHPMGNPGTDRCSRQGGRVFRGLGLIVGLPGRIAAFGVMCTMIVAMVHVHDGLFLNSNGNQKGEGFEGHLPAIAIALAILMEGSGALWGDGSWVLEFLKCVSSAP